jgi:hypothetical protein
MKEGYGAPYVKAFYAGQLIQDIIESFKYTSSEKTEDDGAEVNIRTADRFAPDKKAYQEGAVWTFVWGYIKGPQSPPKKVVINDVKVEYTNDNILITLGFTSQAFTTKQRSTNVVHENTNLVGIAHDLAKVHGVNAYVELPGGQSVRVLTTDELRTSLKNFAKKMADKNAQDKKLFGTTDSDVVDQIADAEANSFSGETQRRDQLREILTNFTPYSTMPQGNRSDRQLLDELGQRQPGGPYLVDTTDGDITIRKRNFNQAPVRTFTWGGTDGEVSKFCPEAKNKKKGGVSTNINFGGWDKANKTYFNSDVNLLNGNDNESLSKFQKDTAPVKDIADNVVLGHVSVRLESPIIADATNVVKVLSVPITAMDKKEAIQNTIDYFNTPDGLNKQMNDPTTGTPGAGLDNAANLRNEAELSSNPGSLDAAGDPNIFKGQIITVKGVSKKHSGNWYVTKCVHEIDGYKPYEIKLEIVRQGASIKVNNQYKSAKETGKQVNNQTGATALNKKTRQLTFKSNP